MRNPLKEEKGGESSGLRPPSGQAPVVGDTRLRAVTNLAEYGIRKLKGFIFQCKSIGINEDVTAMSAGIDLSVDYGAIWGRSHGVRRGGLTVEMLAAPRVFETLGLSIFC
ncbi:uncharacterized protein [Gossypium hirsutum]|uniref:Uncharacterized protein n=1 Tax=Gossypium hirsutum TaxID=3635 RepID=A0ABM3BWF0_GOSHI|nr:uncharacterized protein LOC121230539 [Gossypium hirsutum]